MGILDEAIREHLELKRQHGAGEPELKQLEDEAFGPPERPGGGPGSADQLDEAPTEFMSEPGAEEASAEGSGIADGEASPRQQAAARVAELQEPPQVAEPDAEEGSTAEEPQPDEEALAEDAAAEMQQEPSAGPSTEERRTISEQPTEFFDVEKELAEASRPGPSEEDLVDEGVSEPRLAPIDPLAGLDESDEIAASGPVEADAPTFEDEEDFFDEKRLSDELDEALEAPIDSSEEEMTELEEEEAEEEPPAAEAEAEPESEEDFEPESEEMPAQSSDEDVLEGTPDFLEEAPEDDELWFEQKPPKDFDFDD